MYISLSGTPNNIATEDTAFNSGFIQPPNRENISLSKVSKLPSSYMCKIYESIFKEECELLHRDPKSYPITLMFMPLFI